MRTRRWQMTLALSLLGVSFLLYATRWTLFPSWATRNEMWRFFLGDIAFLFVQVVLVTLVLDGMLRRRQRDEMLTKLNMVIGAFFSEAGTDLLGQIARADSRLVEVRDDLVPTMSWSPADYDRSKAAFTAHKPKIDLSSCDLEHLRDSLAAERGFLIGLLGNQNLLEHETFTDLLWALTHLGEELTRPPGLVGTEHRRLGPHRRGREARLHAARHRVARLPAAPPGAVPVPVLTRGTHQSARRSGSGRGYGLRSARSPRTRAGAPAFDDAVTSR